MTVHTAVRVKKFGQSSVFVDTHYIVCLSKHLDANSSTLVGDLIMNAAVIRLIRDSVWYPLNLHNNP